MTELRQALNEINAIRAQVARGSEFRGYGPLSIACSGLLALIVAAVQVYGMGDSGREASIFLSIWVATAAVSVALTTVETIVRARRVHSGFASAMIHAALEQFLPSIAVGMALTAVVTRVAPAEIWMLPGLWELLFGLGVFASCRFLPRQMFAVGIWYLVAGLACLTIASGPRTLMPWEMGIPFGVGQLLVAAVLHFGFEGSCEESH
jgi:hypothetical protein